VVSDDLEQAIGAELVDLQKAKLVNTKDIRFDVLVQGALNAGAGNSTDPPRRHTACPSAVMKWLLPRPVPEMKMTVVRCLTKF
jgi:hypothetical protein